MRVKKHPVPDQRDVLLPKVWVLIGAAMNITPLTRKDRLVKYFSDDAWITRFIASLIILGVASYVKGGFTL